MLTSNGNSFVRRHNETSGAVLNHGCHDGEACLTVAGGKLTSDGAAYNFAASTATLVFIWMLNSVS